LGIIATAIEFWIEIRYKINYGKWWIRSWDHHENAYKFIEKSRLLFSALKSAVEHLRAINKIGKINIMVFSEFGRNVNLNSANGGITAIYKMSIFLVELTISAIKELLERQE